MERSDEPRLAVLSMRTTPHRTGRRPSSRRSQPSVRRACAASTATSRIASSGLEKKMAGLALIPHQQSRTRREELVGHCAGDRCDGPDAHRSIRRIRAGLLRQRLHKIGESPSASRDCSVGIGRTNTPDAFRKACKRFISSRTCSAMGSVETPMVPDRANPWETAQGNGQGKEVHRTERGGQTAAASAAADKADAVEAVQKQPPTKAVPLIRAAMRSHDDDWVPLSVIGSHLHAANSEFDSRRTDARSSRDLMEKTGQFESTATSARPGAESGCNREYAVGSHAPVAIANDGRRSDSASRKKPWASQRRNRGMRLPAAGRFATRCRFRRQRLVTAHDT